MTLRFGDLPADELYQVLGEMVREKRKSRGLTLRDLSEQMNKDVLSRIERGGRRIYLDTILELAKIFDMTVGEFMQEASDRLEARRIGDDNGESYFGA